MTKGTCFENRLGQFKIAFTTTRLVAVQELFVHCRAPSSPCVPSYSFYLVLTGVHYADLPPTPVLRHLYIINAPNRQVYPVPPTSSPFKSISFSGARRRLLFCTPIPTLRALKTIQFTATAAWLTGVSPFVLIISYTLRESVFIYARVAGVRRWYKSLEMR